MLDFHPVIMASFTMTLARYVLAHKHVPIFVVEVIDTYQTHTQ
jgi:hypothetical protein